MNIGSNGQFVIKNGLTPFPNASTGDVIFVSITSDYAVMRNSKFSLKLIIKKIK